MPSLATDTLLMLEYLLTGVDAEIYLPTLRQ
jgi:hypothetical protein